MFINQLGVSVATQEQWKIVKPGDNSLQFDAVDQKDSDGYFVFADIILKIALDIL